MKIKFFSLLLLIFFSACIQDDFIDDEVDPILRITSNIDTLAINTTFQLESKYLNNIGREEEADVTWSSSNSSVISITENGLIEGLQLGVSTITAQYNNGEGVLRDDLLIAVGETTTSSPLVINGEIATTSSYALSGDFTYSLIDDEVVLEFGDNYVASTALPGLYVYLSNNANSISGAYEIGMVEVFSGAHSYTIPGVGFNDYSYILYFCKPFNVKVGDGEIQ